jgi:hypothetical protein
MVVAAPGSNLLARMSVMLASPGALGCVIDTDPGSRAASIIFGAVPFEKVSRLASACALPFDETRIAAVKAATRRAVNDRSCMVSES